jgi:hypothetical protein
MECFAEIIHLAAFESEKAKFFFKVPGPEVMCGALVVSVAALDMTAARQRALRSCIKGWSRFGLLPQLGNSLVSHLEALLLSKLNSAGLDAWHALWAKAGDGYPELEIPLRMLKTGVAYIKTKEEGELLTLPQEERRILRQALKLPDET